MSKDVKSTIVIQRNIGPLCWRQGEAPEAVQQRQSPDLGRKCLSGSRTETRTSLNGWGGEMGQIIRFTSFFMWKPHQNVPDSRKLGDVFSLFSKVKAFPENIPYYVSEVRLVAQSYPTLCDFFLNDSKKIKDMTS